jgi:hypothetical protein
MQFFPAGLTSPLSADLDFAGYQAKAMAIENSDSFPASPVQWQLFNHNPTGRSIWYQYDGSVWRPVISYGTMTLYVDGASGTDSPEKGTAAGADAFATIQYAADIIPGEYGGSITIHIAAGTYNETVTIKGKAPTGNYNITLKGTLTQLASATQDSSVQGSGATFGSITDTGAFTGLANKLLYSSNNDEYRIIDSVTADTATVVGYWTAAPSGAYTVYDWGTVVHSVVIQEFQTAIVLTDIKLSPTSAGYPLICFGGLTLLRCYATTGSASISTLPLRYPGILYADVCIIETTIAAIALLSYRLGTFEIYRTKLIGSHTDSTVVQISDAAFGFIGAPPFWPCVIEGAAGANKAIYGVFLIGGGGVSFETSYTKIRNCDTGIYSAQNSQAHYTANNQYSGNTANETAIAASYGYID